MQIGVGLSLPLLATRRSGGFSPLSLFTGGVQGAWYDPSDINTYMAGLGPELVTNGDFSNGTTGWSLTGTGASQAVSAGVLTVTRGSSATYSTATLTTVVGGVYRLSLDVGAYTQQPVLRVSTTLGGTENLSVTYTTPGPQTAVFTATATTTYVSLYAPGGSGDTTSWDNISVKQVTTIANATMFQDSAGTTPVTAVEQPVGLMLDKSQGLVLGSELVTTTSMVAQNANGTVAVVGSTLVATCTVNGLYGARFNPVPGAVVGRNYQVIVTISTNSANKTIAMDFGGYNSRTVTTSTGAQSFTLSAVSGTTCSIYVSSGVAGESFTISNISIKELPGNHASQATAASRPVLRARYNQATYSEQVDNAAWNKSNIVTTGSWVNQLTAPDGTLTADLVRPTNISSAHYALLNSTLPNVAGTYTCSLYVYASGYTKFALRESASTGAYVSFDIATVSVIDSANLGAVTILSSSIAAVAGSPGWYRAVVTYVYSSGGITPNLGYWPLPTSYTTGQPASVNWAGDGTSGIYIWGAQIVTGSSAGTYQRIAAATDYATAGFLPYLALDGTDDSFGTNSINFSATDKMSVCAGVTKLSDAATAVVTELSATINSNNGSFVVYTSNPGGSTNYQVVSKGTFISAATATGFAAPVTNVLTSLMDISGDSIIVRANATVSATGTGDQGTGNFGNYPLFIGRRNNASLPFNGRIYQMVVCGKALSASELSALESFTNSKTGAY